MHVWSNKNGTINISPKEVRSVSRPTGFSSEKEAATPKIEENAKTWKDTTLKMAETFAVGMLLGGVMTYSNYSLSGRPLYRAFPTLLAYGFGALNSIASLTPNTKKFMETFLVFGAVFGSWPESGGLALGIPAGILAGSIRLMAEEWKRK